MTDFPHVKALAGQLTAIITNNTLFAQYLAWRDRPLPDEFVARYNMLFYIALAMVTPQIAVASQHTLLHGGTYLSSSFKTPLKERLLQSDRAAAAEARLADAGLTMPFANMPDKPRRLQPIRLYYWAGVPNLGDCVNTLLVPLLAGRPVVHSRHTPGAARTTCAIGSVLGNNVCEDVWGSGFISDTSKVNPNEYVNIYALRGPESKAKLIRAGYTFANSAMVPYGDPALLMPLVFPLPPPTRVAQLCIVPHYIDKTVRAVVNTRNDVALNTTDGVSVAMLDIATCDFGAYIQTLSGCEMVASSSLHGLIFAAAYGIPGVRLILSSRVFGGHFKFRDFYGGIGASELYQHINLQGHVKIPYRTILQYKQSVPTINVDAVWKAFPFHAELYGINRTAHLEFAIRFARHFYKNI